MGYHGRRTNTLRRQLWARRVVVVDGSSKWTELRQILLPCSILPPFSEFEDSSRPPGTLMTWWHSPEACQRRRSGSLGSRTDKTSIVFRCFWVYEDIEMCRLTCFRSCVDFGVVVFREFHSCVWQNPWYEAPCSGIFKSCSEVGLKEATDEETGSWLGKWQVTQGWHLSIQVYIYYTRKLYANVRSCENSKTFVSLRGSFVLEGTQGPDV